MIRGKVFYSLNSTTAKMDKTILTSFFINLF